MGKSAFFEKFKEKNMKKHLITAAVGIIFAFLLYYIVLPPLNVHSVGFWIYLTVVIIPFILPYAIKVEKKGYKNEKSAQSIQLQLADKKRSSILIAAAVLPVIIAIIGGLFSSTLFFARRYASVVDVEESVFNEDLPETTEITQIALMDSLSAEVLGNRTLGSLSEVISQFDVAPNYIQINYKGTPQKVANLEYDGFFKWLNNRSKGIPGMVMVDPVKNDAKYMEFENSMFYSESAYFAKDLKRALRFDYPTKIFHSISFEIDDMGNPYYIVSCSSPKVSLFGAMDISEVIIFDPTNGESTIYDVKNTPSWIDIVYTGDLACEKYNWNGTLSGGFINSIIGNKGCKHSTDDFGYIALGDDVWYFTGVTSVSGDQSNVGFVLSNARTGEYKFYPVIGADEHSAMAAAEGEVQEKGYVASFPSLVNISGQASYIMVLKDDAGLVKLYAIVNVENYGIVATGATQIEAIAAYKRLIKPTDIPSTESKDVTIKVENVRLASITNETVVYITAENGDVYKAYLEDDESLIRIRVGDVINIKYTESDKEHIFVISSWSFSE